MKKNVLIIILLGIETVCYSQWSTSGMHISNSNTGNVGLGLSDPATKLHVKGSITVEADNGGNTYTERVLTDKHFFSLTIISYV